MAHRLLGNLCFPASRWPELSMEGSERSVGSWWGCCGKGFENSGEREASLAGGAALFEWLPRGRGGRRRGGVAARREKEEGAGGSGKG